VTSVTSLINAAKVNDMRLADAFIRLHCMYLGWD